MNETPLFEVGKTYKTRDGHDARVICVDAESDAFPVIALIGGCPYALTREGRFYFCKKENTIHDIVAPAPEKIVRYVNIYCESDFSERCYSSRAAADLGADSGRIACVRVEFHKGQFDE